MTSYRKPQPPGITHADIAWIAGISLIALALRSYKLDASLWFDEIVTVVQYLRIPTSELIVTYENLNNHMFHSLQAQLAVASPGSILPSGLPSGEKTCTPPGPVAQTLPALST